MDHFYFYSKPDHEGVITKRQLLSDAAKLFDPVGWFGPIVINFKILLQKLFTRGLDWDEKLPSDLLEEWNVLKHDLQHLSTFSLQRCILPPNSVRKYQFHLFTDALELAYAAVLYVRFIDSLGFITVNLVAGKNKVAPIETVSLPRLELCGAHLGIKLLQKIRNIFRLTPYNDAETIAWTDSMIVLQWLAQIPRTWTTFVANRVSEIQQALPRSQWRHVNSSANHNSVNNSVNNSADCSSRGTTIENLKSFKLWWKGPTWLSKSEDKWLTTKSSLSEVPEYRQPKTRTTETINLLVDKASISPNLFDCDRYCSFKKLIRVVATVIVAIKKDH